MAKTAEQWFAEYGESHQNKINKTIHCIAVPTIFLTIMGFLWSIPTPALFDQWPLLNWATLSLLVIVGFYLRISLTLTIGMTLFTIAALAIVYWFEGTGLAPVWLVCLVLFVVAWIFQFIGHAVEGKKPSFFKDIQFLMIGPAWLMGFIYRRLGIPI